MSAPILESSSATSTGNTTSITLTAPTGIVDNDLLVAAVDVADVTGVVTSPSGWTLLTSVTHDGGTYDWFYKVAASESGNYTFSWTGSSRSTGWIVRVSGADTTSPIAANTSTTGSNATPDPPTSGTVTLGDYLSIVHFGIEGKNNAVGSTAPTDYTLAQTVDTSGGGSPVGHCGVAVASRRLTKRASADPSTFSSGNDGWVCGTILINSANSGVYTFQGKLGDIEVSKMYLGDLEVNNGYLGDLSLWG